MFDELTNYINVTIVSGLRLKYTLVDVEKSETWGSLTTNAAVWTCVEVNTGIICGTYLNAVKSHL